MAFRSVLIANRGEIALRVIRACRTLGLRAIAVCSEADRGGAWLEAADDYVCIGPAPARQSYLDIGTIHQEAEEYDKALASFQQARAILQNLADTFPAVTRFQGDLAHSYQGIGSVQDLTGRRTEAVESYNRAHAILQKLIDANPTLQPDHDQDRPTLATPAELTSDCP